jgi:hypothetical protein
MVGLIQRMGLMIRLGRLSVYLKVIASILRECITRLKLIGRKGQPILIFGLPKSGSTLLEYMCVILTRSESVMPWTISIYELLAGESHSYVLKKSVLKRYRGKPAVIKVHSAPNGWVIKRALDMNYRIVILSRDLNDVAKSYIHYVSNTPYHTDYSLFGEVDEDSNIELWNSIYRNDYHNWINSWSKYSKENNFLNVDYADLLDKKEEVIKILTSYIDLEINDEILLETLRKTSKEAMSNLFVQKEFFNRKT